LALIWVGVAQSKELSAFKACGAAGCTDVSDPALLRTLIRSVENQGEPVSVRTPTPAPFYRLEFYVKGDDSGGPSLIQYYAPSAGRIAIETNPDTWAWVQAGTLRELFDRVTAGVAPFPKPVVARVLIGGKPARDPASYARLFALETETNDYPDNGDWTTISLKTASPTPWSTGAATLEYSPSKNVLWRGAQFLKVPGALASRLEQRKSLAGATEEGSFPWLAALLGGVGGSALIVPGALMLRRRRGR
jgi:hypothetical protein